MATIHQPNSDIFQLFDQLILLAKGHLVYFGPAQNAVEYFQKIGYPCPPFTNPADYFSKSNFRMFSSLCSLVKLIHIDPSDPESEARVDKLIKAYKKSMLAEAQKEVKVEKQKLEKEVDKHHGYAQSTLMQFYLLLLRNFKNMTREPLR